MEKHKQQLLQTLKDHVKYIQDKITIGLESMKVLASKSIREIAKLRPEDQAVGMQLRANAIQRVEELTILHGAPYFVRCEVVDIHSTEKKTYFFAKHQMSEESIYSWIAPVAAIRFESPGNVSYTLPTGEKKELKLISRDQYMIVDGKVLFFAREEESAPRELIYQEHFTKQKSGFILPEIVAQMEKAQDQVIRAHYYGPLVISGPAGSGKTTLALHRVAYLTQAPDTAALYKPEKIVVFVQDTGTKEYFSHLLPELGIHNIAITTFSSWAMDILGLGEYDYVTRYGDNDEERDLYEYQKIRVLREGAPTIPYAKNPIATLSKLYENFPLYTKQKKERKLDRFDLTILLQLHLEKYKKFEKVRTYDGVVNGILKKRTERKSIEYSLIVVDEFQNYLPEQLSILKAVLAKDTNSVMYVGDAAQQVNLGTIKDWAQIGELIKDERKIRLDKVYRNTKNILEYIQSLGYTISIPKGIKEGPEVTEKILETTQEEIQHIQKLVEEKYTKGSVGILAKDSAYLQLFKDAFKNVENVHVLTMNESQGVEFDLVCIVGIHEDTFTVTHHVDVLPEHIAERTAMQRDLLYVALTRAITELHVVGKKKLGEILKQ